MQELARLRDAQEQLAAWQEEAKFAEAFSLQLQASLDEVQRSSLDGQHGLLAALRVDQEAFPRAPPPLPPPCGAPHPAAVPAGGTRLGHRRR